MKPIFMKNRTLAVIFIVASAFVCSSCLSGSGTKSSSVYAINIDFQGSGDEFVRGGDTLSISQIQFLQGEITLLSASGNDTPLYDGLGIATHTPSNPEQIQLISGTVSEGSYDSLRYVIKQADYGDQDMAEDFVEGQDSTQRYSMIISGTLNDSTFEYKAAQTFAYGYSLGGTVDIPEYNSQAIFDLTFALDRIFLDNQSGGFYNPSDTTNAAAINANIRNALYMDSF